MNVWYKVVENLGPYSHAKPVRCGVFILVQDSFQTLKKWVKELKEHGPEDIVVAIAGNKNDLGDIRWVESVMKLRVVCGVLKSL